MLQNEEGEPLLIIMPDFGNRLSDDDGSLLSSAEDEEEAEVDDEPLGEASAARIVNI